jgi:uncharacterized membrane protein YecN with MAPEG domain
MTITMITASFLGLLLVYLSYNVSKNRLRAKVSFGDGGDSALQQAMRAQGNLTEYAPLGLILIGLLEYRGAHTALVLGLAVAFVVGRYMHGIALGRFEGPNPFRFWGTILTWLTILVGSIAGLLNGYNII